MTQKKERKCLYVDFEKIHKILLSIFAEQENIQITNIKIEELKSTNIA